MRRAIASLGILLLLAPESPAQTTVDWQSVREMSQGSDVVLKLDNGESVKGTVESVSDDEVEIDPAVRKKYPAGPPRTIARPTVVRVVWIPPGAPSPRALLIGMAIGGGLGLALGARSAGHLQYGKPQLIGLGGLIGGLVGGLAVAGAPGYHNRAHRTAIYKRPRASRTRPFRQPVVPENS